MYINRLFLVVFFLFIIKIDAITQDVIREFNLEPVNIKISNSLYNSFEFVDTRIDTTNLGIVQVGIMNNRAKVKSQIPLKHQLQNFFISIIDSTSGDKILLFQLRHFVFAETTKMTSETGYCYIRAVLYSGNQEIYKNIAIIDTVVSVKAGDVTKSLLRAGSRLMCDLIINNLEKDATSSIRYSLNEIVKLDSIEKREIKAYNTDNYVDGLYYNYSSFKDQIPDGKIIVKFKKDLSISSVKKIDKNEKLINIKPEEAYAIVYEEKPYISTGYGFYPLYRNGNDFYFVGTVKPLTSNNSDNILAAGMVFGAIGAIIAGSSKASGENYFIVIDHITGGFIHIRKMPSKG